MSSPVYRRCIELLEADLGEELVALDPDAGQCFGFNDVATVVWRSMAEPKTFDQLRTQLLDEYDVADDRCTRELTDLLNDLIKRGLVEKTVVEGEL